MRDEFKLDGRVAGLSSGFAIVISWGVEGTTAAEHIEDRQTSRPTLVTKLKSCIFNEVLLWLPGAELITYSGCTHEIAQASSFPFQPSIPGALVFSSQCDIPDRQISQDTRPFFRSASKFDRKECLETGAKVRELFGLIAIYWQAMHCKRRSMFEEKLLARSTRRKRI